jgi:DNA-directed RNA polymerase specialized sigma24 family protein
VNVDQAWIDTQFADFVRAHTASLLRTAVLLTRSPSAAEELVQDTFAHLYPQWHKVQAADSATGYVRRSLVNRHLSEQRRPRLAVLPATVILCW